MFNIIDEDFERALLDRTINNYKKAVIQNFVKDYKKWSCECVQGEEVCCIDCFMHKYLKG